MNDANARQLAETLAAFEARGPKKMFRDWLLAGFSLGELAGQHAIAAVVAATFAFLAEEDSVSQFVGELCEIDIASATRQAELYGAYVKWCRTKGIAPKTRASFGKRLTDLGFSPLPANSCHFAHGIGQASAGMIAYSAMLEAAAMTARPAQVR